MVKIIRVKKKNIIKDNEIKKLDKKILKNISKNDKDTEINNLVILGKEYELKIINSNNNNKVICLKYGDKYYYGEYALHKSLKMANTLKRNVSRMKSFTDKYYLDKNK